MCLWENIDYSNWNGKIHLDSVWDIPWAGDPEWRESWEAAHTHPSAFSLWLPWFPWNDGLWPGIETKSTAPSPIIIFLMGCLKLGQMANTRREASFQVQEIFLKGTRVLDHRPKFHSYPSPVREGLQGACLLHFTTKDTLDRLTKGFYCDGRQSI